MEIVENQGDGFTRCRTLSDGFGWMPKLTDGFR
nr:MAG TPA: hypothetical protein [Caudoviricetes sp.]